MEHEAKEGKIEVHGRGFGGASVDAVYARARELAETEGRNADSVTEEDFERAKHELNGEEVESFGEKVEDNVEFERDTSTPPDSKHHQTEKFPTPDEQEAVNKEIHDGVDEAAHEQMLEAERSAREEENLDSQIFFEDPDR